MFFYIENFTSFNMIIINDINWMKSHNDFQRFKAWAERYAAFTCSHENRDKLINYIKNQIEKKPLKKKLSECLKKQASIS